MLQYRRTVPYCISYLRSLQYEPTTGYTVQYEYEYE